VTGHAAVRSGFSPVCHRQLRPTSLSCESGKKREVVLTLASTDALKLGGQLDFLQVLMEPLKGLLGSGPSLDIEGDTIKRRLRDRAARHRNRYFQSGKYSCRRRADYSPVQQSGRIPL
jgi:hypothetical protein